MPENTPHHDGAEPRAPDDATPEFSRAETDRLAAGLASLYRDLPNPPKLNAAPSASASAGPSLSSTLDARMRDLIERQTGTPSHIDTNSIIDAPSTAPLRLVNPESTASTDALAPRPFRFPRWLTSVAAVAAMIALAAIIIPWSGPASPSDLAGSTLAKAKDERATRTAPIAQPAGAADSLATNTFDTPPTTPDAPVPAWSTLDNAAAADSLRAELRTGRTDIVTAHRLSLLLSRGVTLTTADLAPALDTNLSSASRNDNLTRASATPLTSDEVKLLAQRAVRLSIPVDSRGARADEPAFWLIDFDLASVSALEAHHELSPLELLVDETLTTPQSLGALRWILEDTQ